MGFSVSGAAAVIFLSMFIAFGMLYTAADNSLHEVIDAQDDRTDRTLETKNTAIEITSAEFVEDEDGADDEVDVTATNTGATALSLDATSLLTDNTFQQGWEDDATVDDAEDGEDTDLWLPGETLSVTVSVDEQPDRVTLTTSSGVSATAEVSMNGGDDDGS